MTVSKPFKNHSGDWFGFSPTDVSRENTTCITRTATADQVRIRATCQNLGLRNGKLFRIDVGSDGLADDFPSDPLENYAIPTTIPSSAQ